MSIEPTLWEAVELGSLADFRNGVNFTSAEFGSGLPIINVGDFGSRMAPDYSTLGQIAPDAITSEESVLKDGDIVAVWSNGNRELIGRTMLITKPPRVTHSAFTIRIRLHAQGKARVLPEFLAYTLRGPVMRAALSSQGSGTNITNLNQAILKRLPLRLPPISLQQKVAAILSAYDDLIDNNRRRIKLLEEMAQRIYREWFVDFRYPGYERVPLVESELGRVPRGWDVVPFTDLAQVLSGGTPRTTEPANWGGAIPFFTPRDAPPTLVVISTEKKLTERGLAKCNSRLYPVGTVFITARGTVGKVAIAGVPMAMNQSCYALAGIDRGQEYILLALLAQVEYLKTNTGGATFNTVIVDTFRHMKVASPPVEIVSQFCAAVAPMLADLTVLTRSTHNLREARDLLLPSLMSGQIDIDELDIDVSEAAA